MSNLKNRFENDEVMKNHSNSRRFSQKYRIRLVILPDFKKMMGFL